MSLPSKYALRIESQDDGPCLADCMLEMLIGVVAGFGIGGLVLVLALARLGLL